MLTFIYGSDEKSINVTSIVYDKLIKKNVIHIPNNDNQRASIFTDPHYGVYKFIIVQFPENTRDDIVIDHNTELYIDVKTLEIFHPLNLPAYVLELYPNYNHKLNEIHSKLRLDFGSFKDEYPEQLLTVEYIKGHEKVLEIGSNIGRNTLVIAHILNSMNNNKFVTLESDPHIYNQLVHNKTINKLDFYAENSALSLNPLIQKGWNTYIDMSENNSESQVNIINLSQLYRKYNITFDTLIIDCEGAFYYILKDFPNLLLNVNLIIMENDYTDISHKRYVDDCLYSAGLHVDKSIAGGWGPCFSNFYEVWIR